MKYQYPETVLLIFAKAPVAGKVKTRLIPALGKNGACRLYEKMLLQVVDRLASTYLCPIKLLCYPDYTHQTFGMIERKYPVDLIAQRGDDLGHRMSNAISQALKESKKALVIGTDCLEYSDAYIESAIISLEFSDVVLGPALDGGYVLIGMKKPHPEIFKDIAWGTEDVFEMTCKNITINNLSHHTLPPLHDIDTIDDVKQFML